MLIIFPFKMEFSQPFLSVKPQIELVADGCQGWRFHKNQSTIATGLALDKRLQQAYLWLAGEMVFHCLKHFFRQIVFVNVGGPAGSLHTNRALTPNDANTRARPIHFINSISGSVLQSAFGVSDSIINQSCLSGIPKGLCN